MGAVVVGKGHQNHEDDGDHREDDNAGNGQSQQCLMELVVQNGTQVVLAAFQLFAGGKDLFGNPVLLHIQPPGVDKGDHEDDGKQAVQEDLKGVVAVDPDIGVQDLIVHFTGGHIAKGAELAQPVAAGGDHVYNKYHLEEKEQQAPQNLSPGNVAEAHNQERNLGFPAALGKGGDDVHDLVFNPYKESHNLGDNGLAEVHKPLGDAKDKLDNVVPQPLKGIQPEIFQIRQFFHCTSE